MIPEELAQEILASVEHGAAIVHLHVRDQQSLTPDTRDFQATIDCVMRHSDLIIQASTGGVSAMSIAERCAPLTCPGVEMASLNVGSVNLGDVVYFNLVRMLNIAPGKSPSAILFRNLKFSKLA